MDERRAARVILLNAAQEVLLIRFDIQGEPMASLIGNSRPVESIPVNSRIAMNDSADPLFSVIHSHFVAKQDASLSSHSAFVFVSIGHPLVHKEWCHPVLPYTRTMRQR
jgi:hypothetical protein